MKRISLVLLTLFASFLLAFAPSIQRSSFAVGLWPAPNDFPMNFDNFATGVSSPFPFTLISHGGGSGGNTKGLVFSGWSTSPNVYDIFTGTSRQNASLQATFNATNYKAVATMQANCMSGYTAGLALIMTLISNLQTNSSTYTSHLGGCVGPGTSHQLNVTVSATPGTNVQVNINWTSTNSSSSGFTSHEYFDNFQILYGSVIVPSYNFVLLNASSAGPNWFDPSQYAGSDLKLTNAAGVVNDSAQWPNAYPGGLVFPDVKYTNQLYSSKLITLYIGSVYSRSLIPPPTGTLQMYVDNPASVYFYNINVVSPNIFPANSQIYIQQGGKNITSGYLDSASTFNTAVVPGTYTVKLVSTTGSTFVTTSNFPATLSQGTTGLSVTINAYSVQVNNPAGVITSVNWGALWNSSLTGIIFQYTDQTNTTSVVGLALYSVNSSGTFLKYSSYQTVSFCFLTGCSQSLTLTVAANSAYFNKTTEIIAALNTTNFLGTHYSLGQQQINCQGCIGSLSLPLLPFGLTIMGGISVTSMIAYAVIVLTAAAFGSFFGVFGFLATAVEVGFFAFISWLPPSLLTIGIIFIALAITGLMVRHERT